MRQVIGDGPPIDLDQAIGMGQAASMMMGKRGRRGVHVDTARRWANPLKGCPLPGGDTAVLATVRWCGDLLTLPEWVEAFERRRAAGLVVTKARCQAARPARARKAAQRQAGQVLDRMGVK